MTLLRYFLAAYEARTEAIRYAARQDKYARKFEARCRAGIIHAKMQPDHADPDEWTSWVAGPARTLDLPAEEIEHLRHAFLVMSGRERADDDTRLRLSILYMNAQGRYGLPVVTPRVPG